MGKPQNPQQSIVRTTRFFSTKEIFGQNTPFSAHSHNVLTVNTLCSQFNFSRSTPHITSHRLACFAPRYLPNGNAKHGLLECETWLSATPLGMFRNVAAQKSHLNRIKTQFSHAISHRKACTDFSELSEHFDLSHLTATTKKPTIEQREGCSPADHRFSEVFYQVFKNYISCKPMSAHSRRISSGQMLACISPMWALWSSTMHKRLWPMPPPMLRGSLSPNSCWWK